MILAVFLTFPDEWHFYVYMGSRFSSGGGGGGGTELGIEKSHLIRGYTCSRRLFSFQITVITKIQLINICTGVDCIS